MYYVSLFGIPKHENHGKPMEKTKTKPLKTKKTKNRTVSLHPI